MNEERTIIEVVLEHHREVQAVYLFGSYGTGEEWPQSDVDIAVLLPPATAKSLGFFDLINTQTALASGLHKSVDLVNLRRVSTVLQKEVVMADRRIHTPDEHAADEFEMLVLSLYQKLNQERAEVLSEGLRSGRFYAI